MPIAQPNATLAKFGYPDSLVHEGRHWAVLVRPQQPTLGSLVLCTTGNETSYADMTAEAFSEQRQVVASIEQSLRVVSHCERINYLMLMMVDPHVHFHVLPRYAGERHFEGLAFPDDGWPALPDLAKARPAPDGLVAVLRRAWHDINREEGSL